MDNFRLVVKWLHFKYTTWTTKTKSWSLIHWASAWGSIYLHDINWGWGRDGEQAGGEGGIGNGSQSYDKKRENNFFFIFFFFSNFHFFTRLKKKSLSPSTTNVNRYLGGFWTSWALRSPESPLGTRKVHYLFLHLPLFVCLKLFNLSLQFCNLFHQDWFLFLQSRYHMIVGTTSSCLLLWVN